jgi:threonine dehydratase
MSRLLHSGITVKDETCLLTMALAFAHLKVVLEPGGAIALAAALFHNQGLGATIIATASGGNVDAPMFARALKTLG